MATTTELTGSFFRDYLGADSLSSLAARALSGLAAEDYDVERLEDMVLDRVSQAARGLGVEVTRSGAAYHERGAEVDTDALTSAVCAAVDDGMLAVMAQECATRTVISPEEWEPAQSWQPRPLTGPWSPSVSTSATASPTRSSPSCSLPTSGGGT